MGKGVMLHAKTQDTLWTLSDGKLETVNRMRHKYGRDICVLIQKRIFRPYRKCFGDHVIRMVPQTTCFRYAAIFINYVK